MIYALMLGREGSKGFPGKNLYPVCGRPLMDYPVLAAQQAANVDGVFVSTDSVAIKEEAGRLGANVIDRPAELCTDAALGDDAFAHGYHWIKDKINSDIELMVLLFANAPTVTAAQIDAAVAALRAKPEYDSAITVSRYNMFSPLRARRETVTGLMQPFVPLSAVGNLDEMNCDRDSQGDVWFADVALSVVRPRNLEKLEAGLLPQRWMGQEIFPIKQEIPGLDIDYEWQLGQVEYWLQGMGVVT